MSTEMKKDQNDREDARRLLHAMTNVDDAYVQEAARFAQKGMTQKRQKVLRFRRNLGMVVALAACLAVILVSGRITGVFQPKGTSSSTAPVESSETSTTTDQQVAAAAATETEPFVASAQDGTADTAEKSASSQDAVNSTADDAAAASAEQGTGEGQETGISRGTGIAQNSDDSTAAAYASAESADASEESADSMENSMAAAGNPYQDVDSLKAAAEITGFTLQVPEQAGNYSTQQITVIDGTMIQVAYTSEDGSEEGCYIRKAEGSGDISGDYTEYPETTTVTLHTENTQGQEKEQEQGQGSTILTLKGENGRWSVATWTANGYTYAIGAQSQPLSAEQMLEIAGKTE